MHPIKIKVGTRHVIFLNGLKEKIRIIMIMFILIEAHLFHKANYLFLHNTNIKFNFFKYYH